MLEYSTGNSTVDTMASIQLTGNIIPQIWYKQIVRDNGKPHLLAISILADVVYWYRPTEIRDSATGQFMGFKKKFSGDLLQRSYQQIADQFGESKRSVTDAIIRLENLGVLTRVFRTITVGGSVFNNVLYLKLHPDKLYEITYPPVEEPEREIKNPEEIHPERKEDTPLPQNLGRGVTKFRERGSKISGEGSQNLGTRNTKNTTENIHKNISSSSGQTKADLSEEDEDRKLKESLQYEAVLKNHTPELVNSIFLEIKKESELCAIMTADLFEQICDNIEFYASDILNVSAYINKCLKNLLVGKGMSDILKKNRNRGRPAGNRNNNVFNQFQQNEYDFELLEQELLANGKSKEIYATSHKEGGLHGRHI